jgi:pre-mRNA-processing factor 19
MWDLRKIAKNDCNLQTYKLPESSVAPEKVIFDHSGIYLACAGDHVRVFVAKFLKPIVTLQGHTGVSTDVKFGPDSKFLASTSMDRTLRFWGLGSEAMS